MSAERTRAAWRSLSQLHESERAGALAAGWSGRVLVWLAAALLLYPFPHTEAVLPAVVLATLAPGHRRLVLSTAAFYVLGDLVLRRAEGLAGAPIGIAGLVAPALLLVGLSYALFRCARGFERLPAPVRRHPLLWLNLAFWALLAALWATPAGTVARRVQLVLWGLLPFLLWRASFLALAGARGKARETRFRDHLFYLWPAFGGTDVPIGKGLDHLDRHEAKTGEALARSQLAGLKLLLLACLWLGVQRLMAGLVFDDRASITGWTLGIPHLGELLRGDTSASVPVAWLALYLELVYVTLDVAVMGHVVVGALRLLGFNVFRNTYKPLLAESLVDFWNRFYYYFKELLVELWFYPTYLSAFRRHPRLRMFTATFAAAFVGNLYYHVLRDRDLLAAGDLGEIWRLNAPRAFYCLCLATGIWASMLRQQARRSSGAPAPSTSAFLRWRRIAGVWTFYALIHVWNAYAPAEGIVDRLGFVGFLVGLGDGSVRP